MPLQFSDIENGSITIVQSKHSITLHTTDINRMAINVIEIKMEGRRINMGRNNATHEAPLMTSEHMVANYDVGTITGVFQHTNLLQRKTLCHKPTAHTALLRLQ